jgi:hypothetical protein
MTDNRNYVSILKGKRGEFDALSWVSDAVKERTTPLIEIVTVPRDLEDDTPTKSLEEHLEAAVQRLHLGWGQISRIFLDSFWVDPDASVDGQHHLECLFEIARSKLTAIPVGGLTRSESHAAAVGAVAATDRRGALLRLDTDDISDMAALVTAVDDWLVTTALSPADVDLVLDLGELTAAGYGAMVLVCRVVLPGLPYIDDWRSLTLASGAFPQFLVEVGADSEDVFDRLDWRLWTAARDGSLPRMLTLGDYAIAHPGLLDIDPRAMRPSASIRYTTDPAWLILKRRWVRHGFDQFRTASGILMARSEYAGTEHCRGCEFIAACAAGGPTGNLTTWRAVGTCHHLTQTAAALANLP